MENNKRQISKVFMEDLISGRLKNLLEMIKNDNTLDLEIRKNYINIYYRGGNILRVEEKANNKYEFKFDTNYGYKSTIPNKNNISEWIRRIQSFKSCMDVYLTKKQKSEREFQQLIVRENNYSNVGKSTDYFIIDIEYNNRKYKTKNKTAQFDLIAVEWKSERTKRKLQGNYKPRLCFFEMKYSDGALNGKAGVITHLKDFNDFINSPDNLKNIKDEMLNILRIKRELNIIKAISENKHNVESFDDKVNLVFLFANHDPESKTLYKILLTLNSKEKHLLNSKNYEVKFCVSNFMGYGLFHQNFYDLDRFMSIFRNQIYYK